VLPLPSGWNLWLYSRLGNLIADNLAAPERASGATRSSSEAVAVSADQAGALELRPGKICRDWWRDHRRADRADRTVRDEQPGRIRTGHGGLQGRKVRHRDAIPVSGQVHSSPESRHLNGRVATTDRVLRVHCGRRRLAATTGRTASPPNFPGSRRSGVPQVIAPTPYSMSENRRHVKGR